MMIDRACWIATGLAAALVVGACRTGPPADSSPPQPAPVEGQSAAVAPQSPGDWLQARTAGTGAVIRSRSMPLPIPLNEPFSLEIELRDPSGSAALEADSLEVDGRMPHHRHGMNTVPRVTPGGGGTYRVEGMLFHMPGRWELSFDLTREGVTERAVYVVLLD